MDSISSLLCGERPDSGYGSGFGRPEQALGIVMGAQMARRLGLPFRSSGAATGALRPDGRSGYERMMTALTSWNAGVHLVRCRATGHLDLRPDDQSGQITCCR